MFLFSHLGETLGFIPRLTFGSCDKIVIRQVIRSSWIGQTYTHKYWRNPRNEWVINCYCCKCWPFSQPPRPRRHRQARLQASHQGSACLWAGWEICPGLGDQFSLQSRHINRKWRTHKKAHTYRGPRIVCFGWLIIISPSCHLKIRALGQLEGRLRQFMFKAVLRCFSTAPFSVKVSILWSQGPRCMCCRPGACSMGRWGALAIVTSSMNHSNLIPGWAGRHAAHLHTN